MENSRSKNLNTEQEADVRQGIERMENSEKENLSTEQGAVARRVVPKESSLPRRLRTRANRREMRAKKRQANRTAIDAMPDFWKDLNENPDEHNVTDINLAPTLFLEQPLNDSRRCLLYTDMKNYITVKYDRKGTEELIRESGRTDIEQYVYDVNIFPIDKSCTCSSEEWGDDSSQTATMNYSVTWECNGETINFPPNKEA